MVSPLAILLFVYCSGDHRDLHSFPTRRSSDLDQRRYYLRLSFKGSREKDGDGSMPAPSFFVSQKTDRKSTRLNSSHTVISYAVFCLKKKKSSRSFKIACGQ